MLTIDFLHKHIHDHIIPKKVEALKKGQNDSQCNNKKSKEGIQIEVTVSSDYVQLNNQAWISIQTTKKSLCQYP